MDSRCDLAVPEESILEACGETELPELGIIEQVWNTDPIPIEQILERAGQAVSELALAEIPKGSDVAVGVGSRGIANLPLIVRGVVERLAELGYEPFVFPAMGSHGGATADGQREMLESLGVTEERLNCEIRSSMDVVQVDETSDRGVPVVADANAASADAIIPINRIKPHTGFDGTVESGLSKMLVIGMGKQRGAKIAHEWAVDWSLRQMIPEITTQLLEELPVVGGVAIVEDQYDETTHLEGICPEGFLDREAELLEIAYEIMPKIPFDEIDVLVVDKQGKDVSGQGSIRTSSVDVRSRSTNLNRIGLRSNGFSSVDSRQRLTETRWEWDRQISFILESVVESLDAGRVEAYCGEKHAHGNGDQRFQRAGTDTRTAVTTAGEHE